MRPASRGGKRNASAWLLLCRRRGRQCDGEWIASHPGPAKGGDWESEEGDPLRLSGRFQPVARTRPRLPRRPEAWWSVHLWEHEIANIIDEIYGDGSKLLRDVVWQIVIGVEFNA